MSGFDRRAEREHQVELRLTVNGEQVSARISTTTRLLHFLRDELGLTGTKEVCDEGECGACTVLLGGRPVNSCLVLAAECQDAEVVTIEGFSHPVQNSMKETHAVQCGFCIPGMVLSAADLIDNGQAESREDIREGLAGNLCRCTGYAKIVDAAEKASGKV